jgi:hypothetical protein
VKPVDENEIVSSYHHNQTRYTSQTIHGARALTRLLHLPCGPQTHTPFFICVLVRTSLVFLAYWSIQLNTEKEAMIKSEMKLCLGALKSLATVWPLASEVLPQIKSAAQKLSDERKSLASMATDAGFGGIWDLLMDGEDVGEEEEEVQGTH